MKRCPQCNRVETDGALLYCRIDGTALINNAVSSASEIETSILPHTTDARADRSTAPTTVLPPAKTPSTTRGLNTSSRRRLLIVVAIVVVLAIPAAVVISVLTYYRSAPIPSNAIESIAVLPFQNVTNDPNLEYLSDGIAESLINSLTQLQQLKVMARATAFRFKGKDIDPQQVGRQLNVHTVLMGRVRQTGDTLNVQVDLVDAQTGAQLWGEEYERKISEVVDVKQAIAREVTEKLRLKLSGDQQQQLAKRDTTNAEAYQFYLRGRYHWNRRTADGLKKAIGEFQQAIERDPNYALGYVGLADSYALLEQYAGIPDTETLPKAKAYAERALAIDESLAEAHASMAVVHVNLWQWSEADKEFKRAIELNPKYPTAHHWYSLYLGQTGRFEEGLAEAKRAQELDPLSMVINGLLARSYFAKGDLDAVIRQSTRMLELDPNFPSGHSMLGFAYLKRGRPNEALAEIQKGLELSGRTSEYLGYFGYANAVAGKRAEALEVIKELERRYVTRAAVGVHFAMVYAGLGNTDQAFAWLEKDLQARSSQLSFVNASPPFESLRSDRRYAELLRRMGLQA
jgi:TolB-like protein/Tfp pilus assembly protein PilF